MKGTVARWVAAFVVAAGGIYAGIRLARYADADDSPGGMLFGVLLMFGSLLLGVRIASGRARKPVGQASQSDAGRVAD